MNFCVLSTKLMNTFFICSHGCTLRTSLSVVASRLFLDQSSRSHISSASACRVAFLFRVIHVVFRCVPFVAIFLPFFHSNQFNMKLTWCLTPFGMTWIIKMIIERWRCIRCTSRLHSNPIAIGLKWLIFISAHTEAAMSRSQVASMVFHSGNSMRERCARTAVRTASHIQMKTNTKSAMKENSVHGVRAAFTWEHMRRRCRRVFRMVFLLLRCRHTAIALKFCRMLSRTLIRQVDSMSGIHDQRGMCFWWLQRRKNRSHTHIRTETALP